jgi:hypothetical protein
MVVRIRLDSGTTRVRQKRRKNRHVALATAALLVPVAVMAYVLVLWRLAADLTLAGQFPISNGLFSHWQVWLTLAASLHFVAVILNRTNSATKLIFTVLISTSFPGVAGCHRRCIFLVSPDGLSYGNAQANPRSIHALCPDLNCQKLWRVPCIKCR